MDNVNSNTEKPDDVTTVETSAQETSIGENTAQETSDSTNTTKPATPENSTTPGEPDKVERIEITKTLKAINIERFTEEQHLSDNSEYNYGRENADNVVDSDVFTDTKKNYIKKLINADKGLVLDDDGTYTIPPDAMKKLGLVDKAAVDAALNDINVYKKTLDGEIKKDKFYNTGPLSKIASQHLAERKLTGGEFSDEDMAKMYAAKIHLAAGLADLASVFAGPVAGSVIGVGATATHFYADLEADNPDAWVNLGINFGYDLLGAFGGRIASLPEIAKGMHGVLASSMGLIKASMISYGLYNGASATVQAYNKVLDKFDQDSSYESFMNLTSDEQLTLISAAIFALSLAKGGVQKGRDKFGEKFNSEANPNGSTATKTLGDMAVKGTERVRKGEQTLAAGEDAIVTGLHNMIPFTRERQTYGNINKAKITMDEVEPKLEAQEKAVEEHRKVGKGLGAQMKENNAIIANKKYDPAAATNISTKIKEKEIKAGDLETTANEAKSTFEANKEAKDTYDKVPTESVDLVARLTKEKTDVAKDIQDANKAIDNLQAELNITAEGSPRRAAIESDMKGYRDMIAKKTETSKKIDERLLTEHNISPELEKAVSEYNKYKDIYETNTKDLDALNLEIQDLKKQLTMVNPSPADLANAKIRNKGLESSIKRYTEIMQTEKKKLEDLEATYSKARIEYDTMAATRKSGAAKNVELAKKITDKKKEIHDEVSEEKKAKLEEQLADFQKEYAANEGMLASWSLRLEAKYKWISKFVRGAHVVNDKLGTAGVNIATKASQITAPIGTTFVKEEENAKRLRIQRNKTEEKDIEMKKAEEAANRYKFGGILKPAKKLIRKYSKGADLMSLPAVECIKKGGTPDAKGGCGFGVTKDDTESKGVSGATIASLIPFGSIANFVAARRTSKVYTAPGPRLKKISLPRQVVTNMPGYEQTRATFNQVPRRRNSGDLIGNEQVIRRDTDARNRANIELGVKNSAYVAGRKDLNFKVGIEEAKYNAGIDKEQELYDAKARAANVAARAKNDLAEKQARLDSTVNLFENLRAGYDVVHSEKTANDYYNKARQKSTFSSWQAKHPGVSSEDAGALWQEVNGFNPQGDGFNGEFEALRMRYKDAEERRKRNDYQK